MLCKKRRAERYDLAMLTLNKVEILLCRQSTVARYHRMPGPDLPPSPLVSDTVFTSDFKLEYLLRLSWHRDQGRSSDGPAQAPAPGQFHPSGYRT